MKLGVKGTHGVGDSEDLELSFESPGNRIVYAYRSESTEHHEVLDMVCLQDRLEICIVEAIVAVLLYDIVFRLRVQFFNDIAYLCLLADILEVALVMFPTTFLRRILLGRPRPDQ